MFNQVPSTPYAPVIPPTERAPVINMIMGPDGTWLADGEDDPTPAPPAPVPPTTPTTETNPGEQLQSLRNSLVGWGLGGVVAGAAITATITALSFSSYRRTGSVVGPALWSGMGSLVVGGVFLLMLNAQLRDPDIKWMGAMIGAQAAT